MGHRSINSFRTSSTCVISTCKFNVHLDPLGYNSLQDLPAEQIYMLSRPEASTCNCHHQPTSMAHYQVNSWSDETVHWNRGSLQSPGSLSLRLSRHCIKMLLAAITVMMKNRHSIREGTFKPLKPMERKGHEYSLW